MSEVMLPHWMRASEASQPAPTPAEQLLGYSVLCREVDVIHAEAEREDEGDLVRMEHQDYVSETVTLETDEDGGSVILGKRTRTTDGEATYSITLLEHGVRHEYTADNATETVRRIDSVAVIALTGDNNTLTWDDELATLLNDSGASADTMPSDCSEHTPGTTVGPREMGALSGIISKATYLPHESYTEE